MKNLFTLLFSLTLVSTYGQWLPASGVSGIYYSSGNVGIGTATPGINLEIKGNGAPGIIIRDNDGGGDRPFIRFLGNSQYYIDSDDSSPKYFGIYSQFGQVRNNDAFLRVFGRTSNWGNYVEITHNGTNGTISTDAGNLVLNPAGSVGIGTLTTGSFKLAVEGKIGAREITVTSTNPWPDYVFENSYNLPSLEELNAYIKVNKHLPEIPSACTIEQNGVDLGEMNMLLLKKVEELTLYMIELKKENELQQVEIDLLKKESRK